MAKELFYKNDITLPAVGSDYDFSKEEIKEIVSCKADPIYFIRNYVRLLNPDKGTIPFEPYPYQEKMIEMFNNNRFSLGLSSRQSGKTTTSAAYFLWYVIFNDEKTIGVMANKLSMAIEILDRIKNMYVLLPRFLKVPIIEWNKKSMVLSNKSRIITSATTTSAFRGFTLSILYGDEFAFVPANIQSDFMASVYPTITAGTTTKIIFTTTPNGMSGEFYRLWTEAIENKNTFKTLKFTWKDVPGRDEKWKEETIKNIGPTRFEVECNSSFLGSSNTLISPDTLQNLRWKTPKVIQDKILKFYHLPEKNHIYFMTVDVGLGRGLDYSTFCIFDITNIEKVEQVAVYRNNQIEPLVFPSVLAKAISYYNNCFVLVENNGAGKEIADILFNDYEIENLLFTRKENRNGTSETGAYRLSFNGFPGVTTTKSVKSKGCINFKQFIESGKLILNDHQTISELMSFIDVKGNGTYSADQGEHDDLVMNCVLFAWAMNERFFKNIMDFDFRMDLYKAKIEETEERYNFSGFFVKDGNIIDNDTFVSNGVVWDKLENNF